MTTTHQGVIQATAENQMEESTLNDFSIFVSLSQLIFAIASRDSSIHLEISQIYHQQKNIIVMFELKSDHVHAVESTTLQKIQESQEVEILSIPKKKIRKVRIKTLPTNDPNEHFYADALIPELEAAMSEIEGVVFEVVSEVRKNVELKVYNSIVEDQDDYLRRLFGTQDTNKQWLREAIQETSDQIEKNIISDIFSGEFEVHKVAKLTKDDIFGNNKNTEAVIKIREQMLKAKISSFKADLSVSGSNLSAVDIFNPNNSDLYSPDNQKTRRASEFVKKMQQEQQQLRNHYKRQKENEKYKRKQAQQERKQIQLRLKEERHQFLKHQYSQKRKQKAKQRSQSQKKQEEFKEYVKEFRKKKPLFKKNEQRFFEQFLVPENNKKLEILKQIRQDHKPISHEELLEHEKQYLEIKHDHMYEKNAERAMESKARGPEKKYYKSKFYNLAMSQEKQRMNEEDPYEERAHMYSKMWQYATQIKTKFKPKKSPQKELERRKRYQEEESKLKSIANRKGRDAQRQDGKHNLDQLHKHIAELRAKGKIRHGSASHTIEHSPKPKYKNYLREIASSRSQMRHSIDYSSLAEKDGEKLKFNLKKLESDAVRREQYLTHLGSYDMDKYMTQKKRLDDEYLETVRAKMALISKYS